MSIWATQIVHHVIFFLVGEVCRSACLSIYLSLANVIRMYEMDGFHTYYMKLPNNKNITLEKERGGAKGKEAEG